MMIPKFRVWHNNKMYTKPLIYDGEVYLDWRDFEDGQPCREGVLLRSTGLVDNKGIEIFEGDILYYPRNLEDEKFGVVIWGEKSLSFKLETRFEYLSYGYWDVGDVIGNIYENPEFIKGVRP